MTTPASPGGSEIPQPSHVSLRIEYDDGRVHEFSVDSPREVRLEVAIPPGVLNWTKGALRDNPYMVPKAMNSTRHVEIGLDADAVEQVQIRDSRVTIAARQALDAFRLATGWSDERAIAMAELQQAQRAPVIDW